MQFVPRFVNGSKMVAMNVATGRATSTSTSAITVPSTATPPNCREDEQAQHEEERELSHPGKTVMERRNRATRGNVRAAEHQSRQIDREES